MDNSSGYKNLFNLCNFFMKYVKIRHFFLISPCIRNSKPVVSLQAVFLYKILIYYHLSHFIAHDTPVQRHILGLEALPFTSCLRRPFTNESSAKVRHAATAVLSFPGGADFISPLCFSNFVTVEVLVHLVSCC